jgi:hypothetical protein
MNRKEFEQKYNGSSDEMFKDALSVFDSLEAKVKELKAKLKEEKESRYYDSVMGAG